ncbi:hypothetical protein CP8484711_1307B, partial [Chlamydia psittaci 84-8471/1]
MSILLIEESANTLLSSG